MDVGLCYETVKPARGGCEHYISDLARRLARDGHRVHLFASDWDADALPALTVYHRIPSTTGPRFLRPWRFGHACLEALKVKPVDVSIGFDKTWGQDILYPQGGLHSASRAHNLLKHPPGLPRIAARVARTFDPTSYSFARLERRQYLTPPTPIILAISDMVRGHFQEYLGVPASSVRVLHPAIDPDRFAANDRDARRERERATWGIGPEETAGLFVAMNYRLKGLVPLLRSLARVPRDRKFRIGIVGARNYSRYETKAFRLGVLEDRVIFLGFRPDPRDVYFAADFLVHPTFYDPCSLVALEALACGLPVVTTQYNGARELFTADCGRVVNDPHDARELAAAIAEISNPARLPARKAAAAEAGRHWTFEDHYRQLLSVFEEVAARKRAAAVAA